MSKCENCISQNVCRWWANGDGWHNLNCTDEVVCPEYKDKSLFVELPCKVGDKLYFGNCIGEVIENEILDIQCRTKSTGGFYNNISIDKIGKTVFLTKEEAEADLKELLI